MAAEQPAAEGSDRSERLLDAAGELLVRWGYRRVTIEDVARAAGIGKGTVYLHFRTKDALFLTVLLRIHRRLIAQLIDAVERDPTVAQPWRALRLTYDMVAADEIARAVYLADPEVLGRLAHESANTLGELRRLGQEIPLQLFRTLREAGVVRTDLPLDEQVYSYSAVSYGFFATGDVAAGAVPSLARRGDLLEHTLSALLRDPEGADDAARLAVAAPEVLRLYRTVLDHLDREWERRAR